MERRRCAGAMDAAGALAQLGERVLCKHEVTGSIPVGSTSVLAGGRKRSDWQVRRRRAFLSDRASETTRY
jgi:hypothetical protein